MRPVVLIIMDGVGHNRNPRGNAVLAARTPNLDRYRSEHSWTLLEASGEAVGLPPGFQGSSEVGHLSMGSGRIVEQELKRINDRLTNGSLFRSEYWKTAMEQWIRNSSQLHFLGLLQDEGVHAHQDHLFRLMAQARKENPSGRIVIHPFLDGRDTPPRSTLEYFFTLRRRMEETGNCTVGTIMGRYYGMDRGQNWSLTDRAFACIVDGEGSPAVSAEKAIQASYEKDVTPSGDPMFDEYIPPHVLEGYKGIQDGDCIIHTNYRQDRAIQLSRAFVDSDYPGSLARKPAVLYVGLTRYYDEFEPYLLGSLQGNNEDNTKLVGGIISEAGLRQLRISETQKFRHVTSFFNGKATTPFHLEDQVEIPSRFDPSSFAEHPEMDAHNITEALLARMKENPYAFIMVNFANGDMVGHTGKMEAAQRAVETVDECVGQIVDRALELNAHIIITADHGNADQMIDYETGLTRTSHSLNPVECIYIALDDEGVTMKESGILPDIGPTVLNRMGLPVPSEMTASDLILP